MIIKHASFVVHGSSHAASSCSGGGDGHSIAKGEKIIGFASIIETEKAASIGTLMEDLGLSEIAITEELLPTAVYEKTKINHSGEEEEHQYSIYAIDTMGISGTTFGSDTTMTKRMFVTVQGRLENAFADSIKISTYAKDAVKEERDADGRRNQWKERKSFRPAWCMYTRRGFGSVTPFHGTSEP